MLRSPSSTGECGSPSRSAKAWCFRWQATHSFVTIDVVSQSQKRMRNAGTALNLTARCVWARCRKSVTHTLVKCPATTTKRTGIHQWLAQLPKPGIELDSGDAVVVRSRDTGTRPRGASGAGFQNATAVRYRLDRARKFVAAREP